jgi:fructose-1,6-bisphosphatase/sedoheptulose 1,7-bisphosphatase-like protein
MMQSMGVRVFALLDGDVAASILTCMPESEVDMMYCVGDMQGRLLIRGKSRTVRKIQSTHYLDRKDDDIKNVTL